MLAWSEPPSTLVSLQSPCDAGINKEKYSALVPLVVIVFTMSTLSNPPPPLPPPPWASTIKAHSGGKEEEKEGKGYIYARVSSEKTARRSSAASPSSPSAVPLPHRHQGHLFGDQLQTIRPYNLTGALASRTGQPDCIHPQGQALQVCIRPPRVCLQAQYDELVVVLTQSQPSANALGELVRISLPSTQSTSVKCKEDGQPGTGNNAKKRPRPQGSNRRKKRKESKQVTRALKVRLYPNATQKHLLRKWVGCARLVFNMVVANYLQNRRATRQFFFRFLLKRKIEREWAFMKGVPYEVLDHAISGAITARDETITRNREQINASANGLPAGGRQHGLRFLSKKDARQTITIRSQYCRTPLRFYVKLLHGKQMVAAQGDRKKDMLVTNDGQAAYPPFHHEKQRRKNNWPNLQGKVECDSKLTYDKRLRHWTFSWIYQKDVAVGETQANPTVAALDPGIVSFYTWYSPTEGSGSIATRDIERVVRLCLQLDKLISATTVANARKRNGHRRAQARIQSASKT